MSPFFPQCFLLLYCPAIFASVRRASKYDTWSHWTHCPTISASYKDNYQAYYFWINGGSKIFHAFFLVVLGLFCNNEKLDVGTGKWLMCSLDEARAKRMLNDGYFQWVAYAWRLRGRFIENPIGSCCPMTWRATIGSRQTVREPVKQSMNY